MEQFSESQVEYQVSVWEGVAILGGAALLIATGLAGLGVKALGNAFDAQRAEAIARSLMTYEIPGGSSGFFGTNIGGGKMAVIASAKTVASPPEVPVSPEVELFLARMPITEEPKVERDVDESPPPENELFSGFSFSYPDPALFQIQQSRTEQKLLCDVFTPVEIQQGALAVVDGLAPLPAVKYEVNRSSEGKRDIVIISALGPQAETQANQVFQSLACK